MMCLFQQKLISKSMIGGVKIDKNCFGSKLWEILKNALETDFHIKIIPHQPILIVNKTSQRSIEDITTYQIDASEKENQYFGFFLRARKCWLIYEAMIGRPGTRTGEKTNRVFCAEHPSLRFLL